MSDEVHAEKPLATALVIGASIAGSSAAAALSPRVGKVIVIDRDTLPDVPGKRRGVPHSGQFHTLTAGGRLDLERLFPGLTDDLKAAGVPFVDPTSVTRYSSKFGWFPQQPSEMRLLQVTRRYLEWYLRQRAAALPNVEILARTPAKGLVIEDDRVVGLKVEDLDTGETRVIGADLVVDASGRPSTTPEWLSEAGLTPPTETTVDARWGYATTYVRVPTDWDPGWSSLYIGPTVSGEGPSATRGASMWRQEDDLVVVTAQGCAGDLPPTEQSEFIDYLSSFGTSEFADLIAEYGQATGIEGWRNTTNRLRDYAALTDRPEGLVVVGDAAAAFNPIYGQGMTLAARGAITLGESIDAHLAASTDDSDPVVGLAERFQQDLADVVAPCWAFSTSSDFNVPGVTVDGETLSSGKSPEAEYADRVLALATEDPSIALKFMETVNLVRSTDWLGEETLRERVVADWERLGSLSNRTPTWQGA